MMLPAVLLIPQMVSGAARVSYTPQILQHVHEDKVYLLESLRKNLTIPSEKLVVDALLSEDGPQAAYLYRKQLADYPDPTLDEISRSRLSSYQFALNQPLAFPEVVPQMTAPPAPGRPSGSVPEKPETAKQTPPPPPAERPVPVPEAGSYTLQFGSFGSRDNAEKLVSRLSGYGPVTIIQQGGMHKVRLQKTWRTEEDAKNAGSSIPFSSIPVPLR